MIQFASKNTTAEVRSMWKTCFGDTDRYMDLYFARQYREENTLIYSVDNKAVASLQMLPYSIRLYGETVPFYYLAGLCTLPEYRGKGYMGQLIQRSLEVMRERNIFLAVLVPAEKWLFGYYEKFGFETVFEKSSDDIGFDKFMEKHTGNSEIYEAFDKEYQQRDFCVLKSEYDFETILKEYTMDNRPLKYNLTGMACVINPLVALNLYAKKNPSKSFTLKVEDQVYLISNGCAKPDSSTSFDIEANINLLARLFFGFHTNKLPSEYASLFEEHQPVLNLMLE